MDVGGSRLTTDNVRLPFLVIVFCSIVTFGVLLYWRQAIIYSQDFIDFPAHLTDSSGHESLTPSQTDEERKEVNNEQN